MGLEIIFGRLILDINFKAYPVYQNSYKKAYFGLTTELFPGNS